MVVQDVYEKAAKPNTNNDETFFFQQNLFLSYCHYA